jgi:hypothetical protein
MAERRVPVYMPQRDFEELCRVADCNSSAVSAMARQLIARGVRIELAAMAGPEAR